MNESPLQAERQQQAPAQPPLLAGYRQALFEALRRRDPRVANFYRGALVVIVDRENPEAIFQAAHSIREMLEKAPLLVGAAASQVQEGETELERGWKLAIGIGNQDCEASTRPRRALRLDGR